MSNTQQDHDDWTAPLREMIASLRKLEARFSGASETIRRLRPDEEIGSFPSLEGIETCGSGDLGIRECFAKLAVQSVERRADELVAEAEEAERIRIESLHHQSISPLEAKIERLERALAYQGAEIAKLKGVQPGSLPSLPHVARADVPQLLGQPGGMGRHAAVRGAGGGARLLQRVADTNEPASADQGFTRRAHPLNVIGSSGRSG
jgi:hypothetical protein